MKKKMGVIQINGIKGILFALGVIACLLAGFVAFPGIVMKAVWNLAASYIGFPQIAAIQGILLWGIVVISYLIFKKEGFMIELKTTEDSLDLSNDEVENVIQRIKMEHQSDILAKALMRAKELEAKTEDELKKEDTEVK